MSEDGGDIEYLDEDEDLVQQYVHIAVKANKQAKPQYVEDANEQTLLVKRQPVKQKRKHNPVPTDSDSDYDPAEDIQFMLQDKKKKKIVAKKPAPKVFSIPKPGSVQKPLTAAKGAVTTTQKKINSPSNIQRPLITQKGVVTTTQQKFKSTSNIQRPITTPKGAVTTTQQIYNSTSNIQWPLIAPKGAVTTTQQLNTASNVQVKVLPKMNQTAKEVEMNNAEIIGRRQYDIKIPDYEDALCLPAKAFRRNQNDLKRLNMWNDLCLSHLKSGETGLSFDNGKVASSTRSVVIRNVRNKQGLLDTTILGRTITHQAVKNLKKTECFQSVLPKYREKNPLPGFLLEMSAKKELHHSNEVILNVLKDNEEELLIAYKPQDSISALYRLTGKKNDLEILEEGEVSKKLCMHEVTCCKMCTECYQLSSRLVPDTNKKEAIICSVCSRSFVSVYNLLSHLKSHHTNEQVRARMKQISKALAAMVGYHYKCRVCMEKFMTIKMLRKHVATGHTGLKAFRCEVGDHVMQ